jgi:hypothetical protein
MPPGTLCNHLCDARIHCWIRPRRYSISARTSTIPFFCLFPCLSVCPCIRPSIHFSYASIPFLSNLFINALPMLLLPLHCLCFAFSLACVVARQPVRFFCPLSFHLLISLFLLVLLIIPPFYWKVLVLTYTIIVQTPFYSARFSLHFIYGSDYWFLISSYDWQCIDRQQQYSIRTM